MKNIGDNTTFVNSGNQDTLVMVKGYDLGGLDFGSPRLLIMQGSESVMLSPNAIEAILVWYYHK